MSPEEPGTIILGAGLAGLSAAFHLPRGSYRIFDAEPSIGGVARSVTVAGFTFDHAIHVLYTKDPYTGELIRSLLGDNFVEQKRSAWIYSHGIHTPYPYQANLFGLPESIIKENVTGLVDARESNRFQSVHNFEEWILATFGVGFAKNFFLPFNRKVWATEPRDMGFQWIADRVMLPDVDQIVAGTMSHREVNYGPNATFWYPRIGGTAALPQAFLRHIDPVTMGISCVSIDASRRVAHFENGETHPYRTLISTVPLPLLVAMIKDVPDSILDRAASLRANRVITVNLGIGRSNISDKHWVYYPEEEFEFHRISFPANFSASLVPNGTSSMMLEFSESSTRKIDRRGLIERTVKKLQTIGVLRVDDAILCQRIVEIDPAYIIYKPDHEDALQEIRAYLRSRRILSRGRFGEWRYLNMDQAILSGKEAAESAVTLERETPKLMTELTGVTV